MEGQETKVTQTIAPSVTFTFKEKDDTIGTVTLVLAIRQLIVSQDGQSNVVHDINTVGVAEKCIQRRVEIGMNGKLAVERLL